MLLGTGLLGFEHECGGGITELRKLMRNASLHTTPTIAYIKESEIVGGGNDEAQPTMYTKIKKEAKSLLECIEWGWRD